MKFRAFFSFKEKKDDKCVLANKTIALGVSVAGQPNHAGQKFKSIVKLLKEHKNTKKVVLIGDGIQRFNFSIKYDLPPEKYIGPAKALGKSWKEGHQEYFGDDSTFEVVDYFQILKDPFFEYVSNILNKAINEDSLIKASFEKSASSYLERYEKQGGQIFNKDNALKYSMLAIQEECAVIIAMSILKQVSYFSYPSIPLEAFNACCNLFQDKNLNLEWLRIKVQSIKAQKGSELESSESSESSSKSSLSSSPSKKSISRSKKLTSEISSSEETSLPFLEHSDSASASFDSSDLNISSGEDSDDELLAFAKKCAPKGKSLEEMGKFFGAFAGAFFKTSSNPKRKTPPRIEEESIASRDKESMRTASAHTLH
jgi:hypothetical protein